MALKLGVQLFSLRNEMAKDPIGTLQKTLQIGYRYLESANGSAEQDPGIGYNVSSNDLNALLKTYNAHVSSAHVGPLSMKTIADIVKYHQSIGNTNIVEAIQFYPSYDYLMARCEEYNKIGKYLVENGMNPLLYHNHYHEYQLVNGKEILYYIMENTDSKYLQMEIDTGWVKRAGRDPIAEMKNAGSRVRIIHIKDYSHTPANLLIGKNDLISWETFGANHQPGDAMKPEDFVEAGTGVMEIQDILNTANELRVEYAILEQDDSAGDIFESIEKSFQNLSAYANLEA